MFKKNAFDILGSTPLIKWRMFLAALSEYRGSEHAGRKCLPEKHICIQMDEGLLLHAVGDEFAKSPPAGIDVAKLVELCRNVSKGQAKRVYE